MARRGENIRKRSDGRWEGRYICGRDVIGRPQYRSIYGKSYQEVRTKLQEKKKQQEERVARLTSGDRTVEQIAEDWLLEIQKTKKHSTYIKYQLIYLNHIQKHIGELPVLQVTDEICHKLLCQESKKEILSKSTLNSMRNVLRQILEHGGNGIAIKGSDIPSASADCVLPRITIFSRWEQGLLLQYLNQDITPYKLGILVCLLTGIRLGEICALETKDICLTQKTISIRQTVQRIRTTDDTTKTSLIVTPPKTLHSRREIPICSTLEPLLYEHMPEKKYLLNGNRPMEPRTYQYMFTRYLRELALQNKNFHALRHTFATNCIASGMEPKCLSEILGHSNVQTTLNRYVHPTPEMKQKQMDTFATNYGQISGQEEN